MILKIGSFSRYALATLLLAIILSASCTITDQPQPRKIGVAFLVHGGFDTYSEAGVWDTTLQMFAYDPNSFVYQKVIWNPEAWPMILRVGNAPKEIGKYSFELERIGGFDPAMEYSRQQLEQLTNSLRKAEKKLGVEFVTDYVNWIGDIEHLPNPRMIYNPPGKGAQVTYCGSAESPWPDCSAERYNTDGSIERMLKAGVDTILVVDLTTSGVRFFKSYDVIRTSRDVVAKFNAANDRNVQLHWLNDPNDLMRRSYPDQPDNWTNSLGRPEHDPKIKLEGSPNPVAADKGFALIHVEGLEKNMNPAVKAERTGVLLVNHATRSDNQWFDPKIDDTLILNSNIRDLLIARNSEIKKEHVVGAWMGITTESKNIEPRPPSFSQLERSREMRGENLGHAYLYETEERFPKGEWGYLYWDALSYLKAQGVQHIVIAFPQITVDSVLNLVELPNQIGKEIGFRTWLEIDKPDFTTYPGSGHPFADYWGIWADDNCPATANSTATKCCFNMGGCSDGRPYPPPRLAAPDRPRNDMDPSLAFDVSEFGHLGYESEFGRPNALRPVQQQYSGTWALWSPPNNDPRVGQLLAEHVIHFVRSAK